LIGLSFFEDNHPNTNGVYHLMIMHKGDDSKPFEKKPDILGDVYGFEIKERNYGQEQVINELGSSMSKKGLDSFRFMFSTSNISSDEHLGKIAGAVVYWSKTHEDALIEETRGGCSCTTF
jgi:hypothetical protein